MKDRGKLKQFQALPLDLVGEVSFERFSLRTDTNDFSSGTTDLLLSLAFGSLELGKS